MAKPAEVGEWYVVSTLSLSSTVLISTPQSIHQLYSANNEQQTATLQEMLVLPPR